MFSVLAAFAFGAPVPAPTPEWVTIRGTVVWPEKEKIPERKVFDLTRAKGGDIAYIRTGGAATDDTFEVDADTRGLRNVMVWLRPDDDDLKATFPAAKVHPDLANPKPVTHTLTSQFCRFDKRAVVARAGDAVEFVNAGKVPIAPQLDIGDLNDIRTIPVDGKPVVVKDLPAGVGTFRDAIHQGWKDDDLSGFPPWGRVRVFDHPHFALTNGRGEFEIKLVPKGKWRVVYLHLSGSHKGKDGWPGLTVDVEGDKKGVMVMRPLAFEVPKK